ncbi:hypothetical protein G4Y79_05245 [Phototrophicus methaneseepsis]|uniref:Uncharacterized protein n=1 Tax=Phototrophicus methaneseepsis TaxID=2710758 RepID=A0A7S8EBA1_9CHLR|nr:hypothetical protein [Phototrophicus methaneseepsis]QPC83786.1 hypothetical protein G4Y79_05245 [Phototrophicus methaneseepsis]
MAEYVIDIVIKGQDGISKEMSNVQRQIQSLSSNAQAGTPKVRGFTSAQEDLSLKSRFLGMDVGMAASAVTGFVGGLAANKVIEWTSRMNEMGMSARATDNIYQELVANTESYTESADELMMRLRDTTRGIVDDTSLQAGANKMIQMGLAQNEDELQRLIGMAVDLRDAETSASDAINDFSLMLSNQSIQRLDNFGISSARVRDRIEELLASGEALDRSQAFTMAVMEEGQVAVDRLGTALDDNATAVERWGVRFQNVTSSIAVGISDVIEGVAGTTEAILGLNRIQANPQIQASVESGLTNLAYDNPLITDDIAYNLTKMMQDDPQRLEAFARMWSQSSDELQRRIIDQSDPYVNDFLSDLFGSVLYTGHFNGDVTELFDVAMQPIITKQQAQDATEAAEAAERHQRAVERMQAVMSGAHGLVDGARLIAIAFSDAALEARDVALQTESFNSSYESFIGTLSNAPEIQSIAGQAIFDPSAVGPIEASVEALERRYERMQQLAEETDYISDDDLETMQRLVEQAQAYRDNVQDAANTFANMNLSQIFGQTNGGRQGEFWDMILEDIQGYGDEDLYNSALDQANLATGRETEASRAFEDELSDIIAKIYEEQGFEAAADAEERTRLAYEQGLLAGMSVGDATEAARQAVGYRLGGGGGGTFTINPGDVPGQVAAENGLTIDQLLGLTGAQSAYTLPTGTFNLPGGELVPLEDLEIGVEHTDEMAANFGEMAETDMAPLATRFDEIDEKASNIYDTIAELDGLEVTPVIKFKMDTSNLNDWMRYLLMNAVTDNGGVVPGEDPRRRVTVNGR